MGTSGLGMDNEMKKLAEEYGIVKIDALNCIDCQLGGKGKFLEADPHHDLMFLSPGMTDFFSHAKSMMRKEGIEETALNQLFSGLRGIILLDTIGNGAQLKAEVQKLDTGLQILEMRHIGCGNVKDVIQEAIDRNKKPKRTAAESWKYSRKTQNARRKPESCSFCKNHPNTNS